MNVSATLKPILSHIRLQSQELIYIILIHIHITIGYNKITDKIP